MYLYQVLPPGVPRQDDELEDAIIIQGASVLQDRPRTRGRAAHLPARASMSAVSPEGV